MGKASREFQPAPSRRSGCAPRACARRASAWNWPAICSRHDRHVTAESLHDEVVHAGIKVSLATVYNTLHQFTAAGLLRQVVVDAARGYFDTNTGDHQHFFLEDEGTLIDIPGEAIAVAGVPTPRPA